MATTDPYFGQNDWSWLSNDNIWKGQDPLTIQSTSAPLTAPLPSLDATELLRQIQEAHEVMERTRQQAQKLKPSSHELIVVFKVLKLLILLLPEPQRGLLSAVFDGGKTGKEATGQLLDYLEESGVDVSSLRK